MKNKWPSKKDLNLNLFWNRNSPSVEIHAIVISSEGYDYENLSKVHRNFFPSTLRASKIGLLVINRTAMAERGSIVLLVVYIFFVSDQTQTSSQPNFESCNLWCLFAKSCWNINTRTMLRILFLFICVQNIFSFGFIEALDSKGNNKYAKNTKKGITLYVSHGMRWCCSFHFRYVTNKIMFTLQVYFARSDGH